MKYTILLCMCSFLLILASMYHFKRNIQSHLHNNFENTAFFVLYIPKREKHIKQIMQNFSFDVEYVMGPDKNELDKHQAIQPYKGIVTQEYSQKTNVGRIACHLGHLKILKEFLKTDKKYAIIFEDDVSITDYKDTENKIKTILVNLPNKFDIIYMDYCWSNCKKLKKFNDYLNHTKTSLCRHFHLVSRSGAQIILDNTLPMYHNGDNMYAQLVTNNKLISYSVRSDFFDVKQNRIKFGSELKNNDKNTKCYR